MKKSKELQKEIEQLQMFNERDGIKGTMDVLKTDHKRSLIGAINELYDRPSGGGGVLIDDQVIVPDKTWSSQKINGEIQSVTFSWSTPVDSDILPAGNYNLGSSNEKFNSIWVGAVHFNDLFSQGGDIDLGNGEIAASGSVFLLDNATIDFTDASFYGDFIPMVNNSQDLGSPTKYFDVLYVQDVDVTGTVNGRDIIADGNKLDTVATGATALSLGETSGTAYRGDRGKIAYNHSQIGSGNPHNVSKSDVGLGNVDNTSDSNKPVSNATQTALNGKANTSHNHTISNITDLQNKLNEKDGEKKYLHYVASTSQDLLKYNSILNTGWIIIKFDTNKRRDDIFSIDSLGQITVSADCWLKITTNCNAYNSQTTTNDRYTAKWIIQHMTASIWSDVDDSNNYSYHRNSEDGQGTGKPSTMIEVSNGDKIRVRATCSSNNDPLGDVTTISGQCSITIEAFDISNGGSVSM